MPTFIYTPSHPLAEGVIHLMPEATRIINPVITRGIKMKKDYTKVAEMILEKVGGIDNIISCENCVTRIRLYVKNKELLDKAEIKKISGVLGVSQAGEEFQIIIGADVRFVYNALMEKGISNSENSNNQKKNAESKKFSIKRTGNTILGYVAPTMMGIIPIMIGAGMCKTIAIILGPDLLGVLSDSSDLYYLLTMVFNAMMYFMPITLGYTACKTLNINPLYGIFMGALFIAPDFISLIGVREAIKIYFVDAPIINYSSSFLPIMLACPILKYVLTFFEKKMPAMFSAILVPLGTILVMMPFLYLLCGPLGTYAGELIGSLFSGISEGNIIVRILGSTVLCIAWPFLILLGMHNAVVNISILSLNTVGYDAIMWPTAICYNFAMMGCALAAFLKIRVKEEKSMALSDFITSTIGGITEPTMYGIVVRYKRGFYPLIIACAVSGMLCGIFGPKVFSLAGTYNIISVTGLYAVGGIKNLIGGMCISLISLAVAVVASFILVDYTQEN